MVVFGGPHPDRPGKMLCNQVQAVDLFELAPRTLAVGNVLVVIVDADYMPECADAAALTRWTSTPARHDGPGPRS